MWDYLGFLVLLVQFRRDTWDIVAVALSILYRSHDVCRVLIERWLSCRSIRCTSHRGHLTFGVVQGTNGVEEQSRTKKRLDVSLVRRSDVNLPYLETLILHNR